MLEHRESLSPVSLIFSPSSRLSLSSQLWSLCDFSPLSSRSVLVIPFSPVTFSVFHSLSAAHLSFFLSFYPCCFSPPSSLPFLPFFFLRWLPTHSFFYACLLTNGSGRCSPRCLNRMVWAEPLKALASAPRNNTQPLLPPLFTHRTLQNWLSSKLFCCRKTAQHAAVVLRTERRQ